jgi:nucleoside 2-deoxyribosyltransferase
MAQDSDKDQCEICSTPNFAQSFRSGFDGIHQGCPRCGEFKVTGTASSIMRQGLGTKKRALLSGWVRNQFRLGSVPMITTENLQKILASPLPSVGERALALLKEAESGLKELGDRFNISDPRFLSATYSSSQNDIIYLMRMLKEQGYAEISEMGGNSVILPRGYMQLEEARKDAAVSVNGFVAMSFQEDLAAVYSSGFQVGIIGAGYDLVRMDRVEHVNRIDDEIIKQINASKFVVADFTGHRGGVYFEAGYALGRGIPIFWTCSKAHMTDMHFDIRQFNCIDWSTREELAKRLQVRIEAVLGRGPR